MGIMGGGTTIPVSLRGAGIYPPGSWPAIEQSSQAGWARLDYQIARSADWTIMMLAAVSSMGKEVSLDSDHLCEKPGNFPSCIPYNVLCWR
jgi:hypothetical protein